MTTWYFIIVTICSVARGVYGVDGGIQAELGQYPYVIALWWLEEFICSGVIIDETHVLTAGHCVVDVRACELSVLPGFTNSDQQDISLRVPVISHKVHPDFKIILDMDRPKSQFDENDIAVITLAYPLDFQYGHIAPAVFSYHEIQRYDCTLHEIVGWDYVASQGIQHLFALWVNAFIYSPGHCRSFRVSLLANELCALDEHGSAIAAPGDSGSPIFRNGKVIGIVVRGKAEIDGEYPTTFLTTFPYMGFINGTGARPH